MHVLLYLRGPGFFISEILESKKVTQMTTLFRVKVLLIVNVNSL